MTGNAVWAESEGDEVQRLHSALVAAVRVAVHDYRMRMAIEFGGEGRPWGYDSPEDEARATYGED